MLAAKKSGLGRGFDSLIPSSVDAGALFDEQERIQKIAVTAIVPNPHQPRHVFDQDALQGLADSIKQYGVVQPLVVTPHGEGQYALVAGERRWRAAQLAGLTKVPAVVRTTKELEQLEIAIVENVQRVDLSLLEQAVSIEKLHQQFSMTYEAIAKRLGKASSTVNNIVRLLQLPNDAREALEAGKIVEGHARAILSLKDTPEKQTELLQLILQHGWTVRHAEQFVVSVKEGYRESGATKERMQTETPATKKLSQKLGDAPVHIRRMARGGKLEIGFKTDEELDMILAHLS
ncbi:MAG TPA: ParB/RepB/Spo0J family partition protein [Candidatus Saccharimonadales bacterium]|nr:ParB/RepB/Spo0J family partition protein [Candidatus Saccharimonadales bacterium]